MKHLNRILITMAILSLIAGCAAPRTSVSTPLSDAGDWPTETWRSSTPEEQGMDSTLLTQLFARIQRDKINLHTACISRRATWRNSAIYT